MKLRFSLRMLLLGTVVVAAGAAFIALRMQPARVAVKLQVAVRRNDQNAVSAMLHGDGIEQTLNQKSAFLKDPLSWKFISCDISEQSTDQWLRGVCAGRFIAEFYFKSENEEGGVSAYQTCYYDVAISNRGVEIVKFSHEDPLVAVWDNSMVPADDAAMPAND
jgi:hypothetical protein